MKKRRLIDMPTFWHGLMSAIYVWLLKLQIQPTGEVWPGSPAAFSILFPASFPHWVHWSSAGATSLYPSTFALSTSPAEDSSLNSQSGWLFPSSMTHTEMLHVQRGRPCPQDLKCPLSPVPVSQVGTLLPCLALHILQ
jgi:hypothetical protein